MFASSTDITTASAEKRSSASLVFLASTISPGMEPIRSRPRTKYSTGISPSSLMNPDLGVTLVTSALKKSSGCFIQHMPFL